MRGRAQKVAQKKTSEEKKLNNLRNWKSGRTGTQMTRRSSLRY